MNRLIEIVEESRKIRELPQRTVTFAPTPGAVGSR